MLGKPIKKLIKFTALLEKKKKKKMRGFRALDGLLVLGNGASKCNMVSLNVSAMSKLLHGKFYTNNDGNFVTNKNTLQLHPCLPTMFSPTQLSRVEQSSPPNI